MLAPVGMTYQRVEDRDSRERAQRKLRRLKRKHRQEREQTTEKQGDHIDIKV